MSLAVVRSRAPASGRAPEVTVEVHLANGLPSFSIVGLPDLEVRESRERVRAALQNCGFDFPVRRITVNLAPADLPKESGRFDLPIALGHSRGERTDSRRILAASRVCRRTVADRRAAADARRFRDGLRNGAQRRCLRAAVAAHFARQRYVERTGDGRHAARDRTPQLYLPAASAAEAALVPGVDVYGAADLPSLCAHLAGAPDARLSPSPRRTSRTAAPAAVPDMADVIGQRGARRALEVAAAGGHHVLADRPARRGQIDARRPPARPAAAHDRRRSAQLRRPAVRQPGRLHARRNGGSGRFARRIIRRARRRWSAGAIRRNPAKSRWRIWACCFWTNCPNSIAMSWKRCASHSKPAASRSRAPPCRRISRPPAN